MPFGMLKPTCLKQGQTYIHSKNIYLTWTKNFKRKKVKLKLTIKPKNQLKYNAPQKFNESV